MKNQRQGVCSTKLLPHQQTQMISEAKLRLEEKRCNVLLTMYN